MDVSALLFIERNGWLRAQEQDAVRSSLFTQSYRRITAGKPGADNDRDLLSGCVGLHRDDPLKPAGGTEWLRGLAAVG
jgi:hypothetical protein